MVTVMSLQPLKGSLRPQLTQAALTQEHSLWPEDRAALVVGGANHSCLRASGWKVKLLRWSFVARALSPLWLTALCKTTASLDLQHNQSQLLRSEGDHPGRV